MTGRMRRTHYSEHTASKIQACIRANPGLRAKEIAERVGLRRETVNSYLYSKQSGALGNRVWQDANYGWYLKESAISVPNDYGVPKNRNLGRRVKSVTRVYSAEFSSYSVGRSTPPVPDHKPLAPPRDREEVLLLTLAEAFQGFQKILSFSGESIVVVVPPKTRPGTKLCVEGKGFYNPDRSQRGNLYLRVETTPDDMFRLVGNDVMCVLTLPPTLAEQGGKIQVPLLEGAVTVTLPPRLQSGRLLRLIGKGWENAEGKKGNLLLKVFIPVTEASSAPSSIPVAPPEQLLETSSATPLPVVPPDLPKQYSIEAIQQVFRRDDFNALNDEEQGKLAQMLEEAELSQKEKVQVVNEKPKTLALRSPWVWAAILLGSSVVFTWAQVAQRMITPPPVPVETHNR